jgi:hypothetical protein
MSDEGGLACDAQSMGTKSLHVRSSPDKRHLMPHGEETSEEGAHRPRAEDDNTHVGRMRESHQNDFVSLRSIRPFLF